MTSLVLAIAASAVLSGCAIRDNGSLGPAAVSVVPGIGKALEPQDPQAIAETSVPAGVYPTRVQIPAIDVDAPLEDLHRDADGVLLPPDAWLSAGWYADGVVPGDIGPAVIAGHVDTTERAAVFVALDQLVAGDQVTVQLSDGESKTFVVDSSLDVAKSGFPTNDVYGQTPNAQLRLITCNGPFDDAAGKYSNNLVVFAHEI